MKNTLKKVGLAIVAILAVVVIFNFGLFIAKAFLAIVITAILSLIGVGGWFTYKLYKKWKTK